MSSFCLDVGCAVPISTLQPLLPLEGLTLSHSWWNRTCFLITSLLCHSDRSSSMTTVWPVKVQSTRSVNAFLCYGFQELQGCCSQILHHLPDLGAISFRTLFWAVILFFLCWPFSVLLPTPRMDCFCTSWQWCVPQWKRKWEFYADCKITFLAFIEGYTFHSSVSDYCSGYCHKTATMHAGVGRAAKFFFLGQCPNPLSNVQIARYLKLSLMLS